MPPKRRGAARSEQVSSDEDSSSSAESAEEDASEDEAPRVRATRNTTTRKRAPQVATRVEQAAAPPTPRKLASKGNEESPQRGGNSATLEKTAEKEGSPRVALLLVIAIVSGFFFALLGGSDSGSELDLSPVAGYRRPSELTHPYDFLASAAPHIPAQARATADVLNPALSSHAEARSSDPLCIVALTEGEGKSAVPQRLLSGLFEEGAQRIYALDGEDLKSQTSYNVHASVLEAADLHFASSQAGAIVIDNVDRLQAPSRLLWELCDDSSLARYPHAVVYLGLSAELSQQFSGGDACSYRQRELRDFLRGELEKRWDDPESNTYFLPLWSRISNAVVFPSETTSCSPR